MTLEELKNKRKELLINAQNLNQQGNIEDAQKQFNEAMELKDKIQGIEEMNKKIVNENAMIDNAKATNIAALSNNNVKGGIVATMGNANNDESLTNSIEYRKAFMNYALKGTAMPSEFMNADANTKTTDVGVMIPETVLQKIIEKMEATGMILPLVTRTSYKGGIKIPTSTVKPTASWVAEGAGSDKQKKTTGSISFSYNKLRCAVSVSIETDTMALTVFETTLINNVTDAMTKAIEQSIINGDGSGKPAGILNETVADGQNVDIAKASSVTYKTLIDAESKLPLAYENGAVWFMTKKTFMQFIGMTDTQGQPIARVNYGINGNADRTLLGRKVILNDYMSSYTDTVDADTVVAFLFKPSDYVLNTNLNMTIKKYEDNDTDDMVTKAIMLVDGKVVDNNSLVTVTKKSA